MKRENFGSRLGFILVSAGCAVGIGNVWRFPSVAGENGGGVFVLIYLLFLVLMGVPILSVELAVGRAGQGSAGLAYRNLEPAGSKWHLHGWICLLGNLLLMMYYTTVSGWMLSYFFKTAGGALSNLQPGQSGELFNALLADPLQLAAWMAVTVLLAFLACRIGLQNGLERISKVMMSALLVLILILAVHSFTLPGAAAGLEFYLKPDLARAQEVGLINVISAAMNQAFFTLSIGMGSMAIFGSYMSRDRAITGEAVRICALDTFVAICAGLIIFPACYTFGISPDSGPSLIFVTLPNVFSGLVGGRLWGSLFFLFMTFASFSTVMAVFENIIAFLMDDFKMPRKKAAALCGVVVFVASLPCVLGFNILSGVQPLGAGSTILDFEDFIVSALILPIGSLVYLLFCTLRSGWGWDNTRREINTGSGVKLSNALGWYFKIVLPVLLFLIIVRGLI